MTAPLIRLHDALDRTAASAPGHPAVRCGGEALTYGALAHRGDQLAHVLAEAGVERGDRVALLLDKGLDATTALYGILKAGAAIVPLDTSAPLARLAFILQDCGIRCVVTQASRAAQVRDLVEAGAPIGTAIGLDAADDLPLYAVPWSGVDAAPATPPDGAIGADDLAYVLYTSGSTGVPKGVVHTHGSGLAWATVTASTYGLRPSDRLSSHAPLHFDLSTFDYFAAAVAGATTVVVPTLYTKLPASLSSLLADERVTVAYAVPFAFTQLVRHGALDRRDLSALRWVLFAGEPFPPRPLRALMRALPQARFSNIYGPTEVNGVTHYTVPASFADATDEAALPIGRPFEGVETAIVADDGCPVAPGETGELLVHTPTQMRGYWGRPDLDADAFAERDGVVFHRTGDLVRTNADGDLLFLGRKDRQVKTRGYRVELAEVEAALAMYEAVNDVAVFAIPDDTGSHRLVAAIVTEAELELDALRRHALDRLPAYAVPTETVVVDAFPRTPTGKVDRLALQAQAIDPLAQGHPPTPTTS